MTSTFDRKFSSDLSKLGMAILAVIIALVPAVDARAGSKNSKARPADVVAHTQIPGGPATRMLLLKKADKRFLLLKASSSAVIAVLDVTDSSQPRAIDATSVASASAVSDIEILADTLTVFGAVEVNNPPASQPAEIRGFSGVTSFVIDKRRGLIYVANGEGLWIVKTKQRQAFDNNENSDGDLYSSGG